jgi:hypothetical protein
MKITTQNLECTLEFGSPDSEGWMTTFVNVSTTHFKGNFKCTLLESELKDLKDKLHYLESTIGENTEISWGNIEENINLKIKLNKIGKIEGEFKFSPDNFSIGPVLSGTFEADQTYLSEWLKEQ